MSNIQRWRDFRETIKSLPEEMKIKEALRYWEKSALVNFVLDYEDPEQWPTPWELISDDYYDSIVISIMIVETLILSGFHHERFELRYIHNDYDSSRFMIVIIDGKLVLNYSYGEILDFQDIKDKIKTIQKIIRLEEKYIKG